MMKMKKQIISWGMMLAAAFTLTNCAQEIENPNEQPETVGYPFEIVASTVDTKTVNDGMSTKWDADDKINLFHAVCDGTNYKNNGAFTVKDVEEGIFNGNLFETLDPQEEYDWYALYPYNEKIITPAQQTAGYTYIGYSKGLNQTGYNSMASLKETVCPLYGVLKSCPAGDKPVFEMQHLSSVVAINVTNANEEPLTVTTASLTAEEDIVGSYYFDLTTTPVTITKSGDSFVYKTATVNVTSGATALAKGESAVLYLAIKPFIAATGEKLVLSVNGYEKELTMTKDVTFTAGKIKILNFSYDKEPDPVVPEPEGTVNATISFASDAQRISHDADGQVWENDGITFTNAKHNSTNPVVDNVNPVRLYKNSKITIEAPGNIVKVEFNSATGDYFGYLKSLLPNASVNGQVVTEVYDGSSNTVEYELSTGQLRLNSLTVTYSTEGYVPPVLESIAVSGDYKTEFIQGSTFSFGGVVTATYDNGSTKNVTADCVFSGYDLEQLGDQTVTVSYEGETAEYDITVIEKPTAGSSVTVEMSSFSKTEDALDDVISYTTAKGGGTSNPAINNSIIRIYQANSGKTEGGSITIKAADGYTLTSVTIGSNMKTSIAYTIGNSTTKSSSESLSANGKYTVDDINSNSITFYCMGTTSSTRLYVNYLSATYTN